MLGHRCAGIGHIDGREFFGSIEYHLFVIDIAQLADKLFIALHVDGAVAMGTGQHAAMGKGLVDLIVDVFIVVRVMRQTKTYRAHHRTIV